MVHVNYKLAQFSLLSALIHMLSPISASATIRQIAVTEPSTDYMNGVLLECGDETYAKDGRCCSLCPSGMGMISECNSINDTVCEPCLTGTTFQPDNNHKAECRACSKCGSNTWTSKICDRSHDTICQCEPGYYLDRSDQQCKQCLECAIGWGASPACSSTRNTVCQHCPPGSYSTVKSSTKSCQSCTKCGPNELPLTECSDNQDTVCFAVQQSTSGAPDKACNGLDCTAKDTAYLYTVPLYCAILGAIVVGLLLYVILRCRANKRRMLATMEKHHHYLAQRNQQNYPYICNQSQSLIASTYPIVYMQGTGSSTVTTSSSASYFTLPQNVKRTIQKNVGVSDNSWMSLAVQLGFTAAELATFKHRAEITNNKQLSPADYMMMEWSRRENSSVPVLAQALKHIDRPDLVKLLYAAYSMKGSEVV